MDGAAPVLRLDSGDSVVRLVRESPPVTLHGICGRGRIGVFVWNAPARFPAIAESREPGEARSGPVMARSVVGGGSEMWLVIAGAGVERRDLALNSVEQIDSIEPDTDGMSILHYIVVVVFVSGSDSHMSLLLAC
jgi:hypothetical protein